MPSPIPQSVVHEWNTAKQIIAAFLRDMRVVANFEDNLDHNSAALLARLAQVNLLVVHVDRLPDNDRDWQPHTTAVPYCDFLWVRRGSGAIELAFHSSGRFQTAESVGDHEGLDVEYMDDVTHWMEMSPPCFF